MAALMDFEPDAEGHALRACMQSQPDCMQLHLCCQTQTGPWQEAKARCDAEADLKAARDAAAEAARLAQAADSASLQRRQAAALVIQVRDWPREPLSYMVHARWEHMNGVPPQKG